jgi:hypothetical protein
MNAKCQTDGLLSSHCLFGKDIAAICQACGYDNSVVVLEGGAVYSRAEKRVLYVDRYEFLQAEGHLFRVHRHNNGVLCVDPQRPCSHCGIAFEQFRPGLTILPTLPPSGPWRIIDADGNAVQQQRTVKIDDVAIDGPDA